MTEHPAHQPMRRARTLWLRRECSCGARTVCPNWQPPAPIPDGDRVPWPTNPPRPPWAAEPTQELPRRVPFMTLGQEHRGRGGWYRA